MIPFEIPLLSLYCNTLRKIIGLVVQIVCCQGYICKSAIEIPLFVLLHNYSTNGAIQGSVNYNNVIIMLF